MRGQRGTGWRQKIAMVEESRCSSTMEKRGKHTHLCDPIYRKGRLCTLQYSTCISVKSQPIRLYIQWDETPRQTAFLSNTCFHSCANETPVLCASLLRSYFCQHYLFASFFPIFLSQLFYSLTCLSAFTKVLTFTSFICTDIQIATLRLYVKNRSLVKFFKKGPCIVEWLFIC